MYGKLSLQAKNLQDYVDKKIWIVVYLIDGTKQRGQLIRFDERNLFLRDDVTKTILKKSVYTVIPT